MEHTFIIIIILTSAGFFGGLVNYLQVYVGNNATKANFWKSIIVGIAASFLVPLFLETISSNLIESSKTSDKDLLVFVGFCLVAAIFSRRFIDTIGERILKKAEEANKKADEAKEIAIENKEEVNLISTKATEVDDSEKINANAPIEEIQSNNAEKEYTKEDYIKFILNILLALKDSRYTFRTLQGISESVEIPVEKTKEILTKMIEKEWVTEINRNDKILYAITERGNKLRISEADLE